MRVLFAALDKPATPERLEGFWHSVRAMSLSEFIRARDALLGAFSKPADQRRQSFTPGDVWDALKALKARPPVTVEAAEPEVDRWVIAGNSHLMHHLLTGAPGRYLSPADRRSPAPPKDPESHEQHAILVAAKNVWAQIIRRDYGDTCDVAEQVGLWEGLIGAAEHDCAEVRAKYRGAEAEPAYTPPPVSALATRTGRPDPAAYRRAAALEAA